MRGADARELALAFLGVAHPAELHLERIVDDHIARVLEAADGSVSLAATILGVNRRTLQRHRARHGGRGRRRMSLGR